MQGVYQVGRYRVMVWGDIAHITLRDDRTKRITLMYDALDIFVRTMRHTTNRPARVRIVDAVVACNVWGVS